LVDEALVHWRRYTVAAPMMGIGAAGAALSAYLIGTMTNEASDSQSQDHRTSG
jgi:hypothetical protein